ncbi:MAG: response regulator [Planctomycetaceae bacterium]|nr:response regulator [Planctomycetaceae bacterium]
MVTSSQLSPRGDFRTSDSSIVRGIAERDIKQSCILIVDDEPLNIEVVRRYLELGGYRNLISSDHAGQALPLIGLNRPDVVLLDIHMPEVNGLDILAAVRSDESLCRTPVIILTGSSDPETKLVALQAGATDLLQKPVHSEELLARLGNVLRVKAYQDRLCQHSEELEEAVRRRTAELEASRLDVIHCLARAAEFRDDDTGQHVIRVGRYARVIAQQLGFSNERLNILEPAAQLHDVGKIGIADSILLKPGKLTPEEYELMQKHCGFGKKIADRVSDHEEQFLRRHTDIGARIMNASSSPILELARRIALTHHERWDGSGYPLGLAGEDIPLEGRITAVADVFDALSSKRPYKPAFPLQKCFKIMEEGRGNQFDPIVLDAFFTCRDEIIQIQIDSADTD